MVQLIKLSLLLMLKTYQNWCEGGISSLEFAEDGTNGHLTETVVVLLLP